MFLILLIELTISSTTFPEICGCGTQIAWGNECSQRWPSRSNRGERSYTQNDSIAKWTIKEYLILLIQKKREELTLKEIQISPKAEYVKRQIVEKTSADMKFLTTDSWIIQHHEVISTFSFLFSLSTPPSHPYALNSLSALMIIEGENISTFFLPLPLIDSSPPLINLQLTVGIRQKTWSWCLCNCF